MKMTTKDYKYQISIYWDFHNKYFTAEIPELDGCEAHGETQSEAMEAILKEMNRWVHKAQDSEMLIPLPIGRLPYRDELYCINCKNEGNHHSHRWKRTKE
jgi:predicted RNase H-like HicB family nuclease